ncbi:DUF393 domain-containing protein [Aliishimia ponticola]|uniref:DUF393 domain-containing protein n=1 Tax=Aliishimia ponticola TaxID=2499833 RepID=A0A4S4N941_9RHOB|nr:DUF393 domain-containing protein [Aliishimia ponticola]THH35669.1 DUF393 domain-containing protein [Aliishimia ponticola]
MPITVIHNETCPICSREVAQYGRAAERAGVDLDIQGLEGEARDRAGLTREAAAQRFHVIHEGAVLSGLDAFIALWQELPRWRWLAQLIRPRPVRALADPVYDRILAPALYALHRRREDRRACKAE